MNSELAYPGLNAVFTGIDSEGNERFEIAPSGGMTLRDYFAAHLMPTIYTSYCADVDRGRAKYHDDQLDILAKDAYEFADALLKARASK